jgi:hypothetical protein
MASEGHDEAIDHSRPMPTDGGVTHLSFIVSASLPGYDDPEENRIQRATRLAVDLAQPLRETLIREGFQVGEIATRVSPWGAAFEIGKKPSRASFCLTPYPPKDGRAWHVWAFTRAMPNLGFWKGLIGSEFKANAEQFEVLARVHAVFEWMLKSNPAISGICWNPTE